MGIALHLIWPSFDAESFRTGGLRALGLTLAPSANLKGLKTPKVGNVDMDPFGYVDSKDVELLRKYLANTITLNDDQLVQANMNGDTVVNQADLDLLEQYVAGTITVFPVG